MSGSAALSAARKRRASSSQMGGGVSSAMTNNYSAPPANYYGAAKQSLQGIMNQIPPYPPAAAASAAAAMNSRVPTYTAPNDNIPPINIYENIELIKQQLAERTKLIQTQGSKIQPEKLRVLQKQNEIQTQILRQKIIQAQQMEAAEQKRQQEIQEQYQLQAQTMNHIPLNQNEPEFIYEKGIPRRNPRYRKPEEVVFAPLASTTTTQASSVQTPQRSLLSDQVKIYDMPPPTESIQLKPFVSMITDTGVIPPPIVILKSHDATLLEHHYAIQRLTSQVDELQSRYDESKQETQQRPEQQRDTVKERSVEVNNNNNAEQADEATEEEEEEDHVLLMEEVMNDLTNSREFIEGVVDKIVNETNLSEVIMKIEPVIKENQELRSLIFSQQQMMNEMNMLVFRLLNEQEKINAAMREKAQPEEAQPQSQPEEAQPEHVFQSISNDDTVEHRDITESEFHHEELNDNGLYSFDMTHIVLSNVDQDQDQDQDQEQDQDQDQEQDQEQEQEQDQELYSIEPLDDNYSEMPHFPEPISLIVNEL